MLNADMNQLYFIFLRYMLKPITDLNKDFQSDSADVLKLMNDLHLLLYFYFQMLIPPSRLETVKRADLLFSLKTLLSDETASILDIVLTKMLPN